MSLAECIPGMVKRGEIDAARGARMRALFDELESYYRRSMGPEAAAAEASEATLRQMARDAKVKKKQALLTISRRRAMLRDMEAHTAAGEPLNPKRAEQQLHHAEGRRREIESRSWAMLNGVLDRFSTNVIGMYRHKAELADVVRELFGQDSGNVAAKELAQAWSETAEMLRQRFNAAGGAIGKLKDWGLPQTHDTAKVRDAGMAAWRTTITPLLDRAKMIDRDTGVPMSDAKLAQALEETWKTISTEGWNGRSPGTAGQGALANQRADHRFLMFRDADGWMDYQRRFGVANPFDAMVNHVRGMSRDVGLMETLGPNPNAAVHWLKDVVTKAGKEDLRPANKSGEYAYRSSRQIDRLYAEITGANGRPENRTLALGFSTFRNIQTAAKLGGAVLKKPVEFATQLVTRVNNGVSAWAMIPQFIDTVRAVASGDEASLIRITGIAEEAASTMAANTMSLGAEYARGVTSRMASAVVRLSGLSKFTEVNRWATGMGLVHELTANRERTFGELRPALRRALERQGIDAYGWTAIRQTPLERVRGADWLLPQNVQDAALGDKLYGAIHHMVDLSVPAPTLGVRTWINSQAAAGTLKGELIRSAGQFKAFPIAILGQHMQAIMEHYTAGRTWHALGYAGGLFMTTTLMGALTMELEALKRGEDPRPTLDPKFWAAASIQGGGWGLFGDFLNSSQNHFGGGLVGSIAGPVLSDVGNTALAVGDFARGNTKGQHSPWRLANQAIGDLPGQSLWYSRLAFQRYVTDQAQALLDPHYRQSWQRMEKRAREEHSQLWWQPGQTAPGRAPDWSNALHAPPPDGQSPS